MSDQWQHHHVDKPTGDNDYFERMSRVIFMAGLNWATLDKKWPGINSAFDGFDIETVADYNEDKVDQLMADPDVIRNLPKIKAIINNASQFQDVIKEYGSFEKYVKELQRSGEDQMRAQIAKRFAFMGKGTTAIFLFSIGIDLPKAREEWQDRNNKSSR